MRIWIINHYAVPAGGKSPSRHAALAKYLKRSGHDVTLFAASVAHGNNEILNTTQFPNGAAFTEEHRDGVRWRFIRSKPHRNNIERFFMMRDFGAKVLKSIDGLECPDVVVGSCVHPFAVEAARKIARRKSVPFVYEIRDIWPDSLVDVGGLSRRHPAYLLFKRMEKKAFRDADGVITLLPGVEAYAAQHGIGADRVCYLPNGIDPAQYPELVAREEEAFFQYTFFGAHGSANGLESVLSAAAIVQDACGDSIRIRFVGDGPAKGSLIQRAESLSLKNVAFREPLAKFALKAVAENSDGFIFNLKRIPVIEKYGLSANKLFEYLIHGRPILFSCASYNNPVADAGAGLSVEPESPRAMAEAMIALARTDRNTRHQMGSRGRQYVLAHHDLSHLASKLAVFLEKVANNYSLSAAGQAA